MKKISTICLLTSIVIVSRSQAVPFPTHLISFQGNVNKANKVTLQWTTTNNATVDQFEVQRSYDGIEFKTIGIVFSSEKKDTEDYLFYETIGSFGKVMYRLKMIGKEKEIGYSKILVFQPNLTANQKKISIIGNPVNDKLTFSYTTFVTGCIDVNIYEMTGRVMMSNKLTGPEGNNMFSFALSPAIKAKFCRVEVNNGIDIQIAKFLKQQISAAKSIIS